MTTVTPDYSLVQNIKNNIDIDKSITQLAQRHGGLVAKTLYQYGGGTGIAPTDLIKDTPLLVWQAALKFDDTRKCEYGSFLCNYARFHALNLTKAAKKQYHISAVEPEKLEALADKPIHDFRRISEKKTELLDYIMFLAEEHSNPNIKMIMSLRYYGDNKERRFKNIGKLLGLTGQATKNLHQQFIEFVKLKLASEEMLDIT